MALEATDHMMHETHKQIHTLQKINFCRLFLLHHTECELTAVGVLQSFASWLSNCKLQIQSCDKLNQQAE